MKKKKIISLFLAVLMSLVSCVTLISCVKNKGEDQTQNDQNKDVDGDNQGDNTGDKGDDSDGDTEDEDDETVDKNSISNLGFQKNISTVKNPSKEVVISVFRDGGILKTRNNSLQMDKLQSGDVIEINSDYRYLNINLFPELGPSIVYSTTGEFTFEIPSSTTVYPSTIFSKDNNSFTATVCEDSELKEKRNIALNPYDYLYTKENNKFDCTTEQLKNDSICEKNKQIVSYPHAYANRITRNDEIFNARNAIDGVTESNGHSRYPYQSWGYGDYDDAEFIIYFGREITTSEVGLVLRADYSGTQEHDTYWQEVTLEFSNKTQKVIHPVKSGSLQKFSFDEVSTKYIRIKNIKRFNNANSLMFAALTEFEVYGTTSSANMVARKECLKNTFGNKSIVKKTSDYHAEDIKNVIDAAHKNAIQMTGDNIISDNKWRDGVYYTGLMDAYTTTGTLDQYLFMRKMSNNFKYGMVKTTSKSSQSNLLSSIDSNYKGDSYVNDHADYYIIGEAYLVMNELKPDDFKIVPTIGNANANMAVKPSWNQAFNKGNDYFDWWWCDAIYMGLNTYTWMSLITKDNSYIEKAYKTYKHWKDILYDNEYKLWHRDSVVKNGISYLSPNPVTNKPQFWARGNAWVISALAKQMLYISDTSSEIYKSYKSDFIELANSLKQYQRSDGTWNSSINDYDYYVGPETTGTSGFLYAMAVGIQLGILDYDEYFPVVKKAYDAMTGFCSSSLGKVGYMQTVGQNPTSYGSEEISKYNSNEFGYGLFLMGASALMRMCDDYQSPELYVPSDPQSNIIV